MDTMGILDLQFVPLNYSQSGNYKDMFDSNLDKKNLNFNEILANEGQKPVLAHRRRYQYLWALLL